MLYSILKFVHILSAIVWMGSVFTVSLLQLMLQQKQKSKELSMFINQSGLIGKGIIAPSSILLLLSGIAMSVFAGFGWAFWVIWGLIVTAITGILGGSVLIKMTDKLNDMTQSENNDYIKLKKLKRRYTILTVILWTLLFSAVVVMVFKPTF